jgi:hypothetical protein
VVYYFIFQMIEFAVGNYIFLKEAGKIYAGKQVDI